MTLKLYPHISDLENTITDDQHGDKTTIPSAHHAKTTLFSELTDEIADAQMPTALLKDGSRQADLIDVNSGVGAYDLIRTKKVDIAGHPTIAAIYFYYRGTLTVASVVVATLNAATLSPTGTFFQFKFPSAGNKKFSFQVFDSGGVAREAAYSYNYVTGLSDGEFGIPRAGPISMLPQKMFLIGVYADATRPAAGTPGRVLFNTDDNNLNIDDGTNWILPDGTVT